MKRPTPNQIWKRAGGDPKRSFNPSWSNNIAPVPPEVRARYLALLREHGFVFQRADGVWVHTEKHPRP
jgi:hypothetical protein